jgi:HEAT repeat protein
MSEIDQLGQRGDAAAVQILMTLGDTYTYLNFQAIEALGRVKTPEVARYLAGKTGDKDPKIVAAAMQSLAQVQGAAGIPVIAATLAANRQRPDGFQDTVCAAGVKALGEIGSPQAIPALAEEFEQTVGKTLQHEYGSQVIAAIKAIGDSAGVPALEAYALRLQTQRDAMSKNPMGQHYLDGKLAEVRAAIVFLLKTK